MRHRVYGRILGRTKNERNALFKNLVRSLFISGSIETTQAKAKSIKGLVDKIINQAKTPVSKRLISQFLSDQRVAHKLIKEIIPRLESRNSGYTSLMRIGPRPGDGAMIVKMSLLLEEEKKKKTKAVKKGK